MLLMYLQNALFRSMAAGNFRDLVQQMSLQPAMLIWLDNDPNSKGSPNENFARELMELFTLGVNQYTQADVVASARAWTGHNTLDGDRTQYHFYPNRHDTGHEDVHGRHPELGRPRHHRLHPARRRDAQADRGAVHRREDVDVLRVPEPRRRRSSTTSPTRSSRTTSRSHDARARDLHAPEFLSTAGEAGSRALARPSGSSACMRVVGITADDANPQWWMDDMGQQLFEPPNVSGWRPNEYWLTTSRLWARANWARYIIWQQQRRRTRSSDIVGMTVPRRGAVRRSTTFGIDNPSAHTRAKLEAWLTAQRADTHAWTNWTFINLLTLRDAQPGDSTLPRSAT